MATSNASQRVFGIPLLLHLLDHLDDPSELGFGDSPHDVLLRRVLVEDGGLRDTESTGDHAQRRAADAVLGEEVECGHDDPPLGRAELVLLDVRHGGRVSGPGSRLGGHFSTHALATRLLPYADAYMQLCVDGWPAEITERFGAETMAEIEWAA